MRRPPQPPGLDLADACSELDSGHRLAFRREWDNRRAVNSPLSEGPTPQTLAEARVRLAARDHDLAIIDALVPPFPWRRQDPGFAGLARIMVGQQVSTTAADAMWRRLDDGLGGVSAATVREASQDRLRALSMSGAKARYLHALADEIIAGRLDLAALPDLDDEAAVACLTGLKGVGLWTAETYLMFCEGRLDVFPGGDIALQEAIRWTDRLDARPDAKAAYSRAERWRPYRAVAAHLLWRCYGMVKAGELVLPT